METIEKPVASPVSREARIQSILEEYRTLAFNALDNLMYEAFLDVGKVLTETREGSPEDTSTVAPNPSLCHLSARSLRLIQIHFEDGDLAEWLDAGIDGDRMFYLRDFLNFTNLERKEFKLRHPNAFTKWTGEQDEALLAYYRQSAEDGHRPPWNELAMLFGRNVNAIKLRLEKLGVDLGADAGRPRRSGGFAR